MVVVVAMTVFKYIFSSHGENMIILHMIILHVYVYCLAGVAVARWLVYTVILYSGTMPGMKSQSTIRQCSTPML